MVDNGALVWYNIDLCQIVLYDGENNERTKQTKRGAEHWCKVLYRGYRGHINSDGRDLHINSYDPGPQVLVALRLVESFGTRD